jgi:hypothetical protein
MSDLLRSRIAGIKRDVDGDILLYFLGLGLARSCKKGLLKIDYAKL